MQGKYKIIIKLILYKFNCRTRTAQIRYSESSMRNGFGLKLLHKFFNLPFLQLQKETLLRQLERNEIETNATIQELDMFNESDEANYNKFLENLTKRRREIADSNANIPPQIPTSMSTQQISSNQFQSDMKRSQSASIIIGAGKPIPFNPANGPILKKSLAPTSKTSKSSSQSSGFISKFGVKDKVDLAETNLPDLRRLEISPITSVEEFCPDGGLIDRNFLEDVQSSPQSNHEELEESDR